MTADETTGVGKELARTVKALFEEDDVMAAIDALFRALRYVGFDDPLAGPIGLTLREALARLATVLRRVADAQFDHYVGDELRQAKTRAARQRAVLAEITKAQVG